MLPSTRLKGGALAALDLGGFGYKTGRSRPGHPGLVPARKVQRPAQDGRPHRGPRWPAHRGWAPVLQTPSWPRPPRRPTPSPWCSAARNASAWKPASWCRHREPVVTARVEAQYLPADKEIQIISRTIQEMRVTIPPHWAPEQQAVLERPGARKGRVARLPDAHSREGTPACRQVRIASSAATGRATK